jgi:flagellar biosynthesis protein FlhB
MAEQAAGERTEAPTPKRREDTRKEGEVPRSVELTTAFLLLAGTAAVGAGGEAAGRAVLDVFGMATASLDALPSSVDGARAFVAALGWRALAGMAPALFILSGTALAVSALQARGVLSLEPLQPKWSRVDPISKVPQLWGWKALAELVKSLGKLALVGLVVWPIMNRAMGELPGLAERSPYALLDIARRYTVRMMLAAGTAYLIIALADYAYQVWQHEKQLRMSREEIKREVKENEGDQIVKVRRRTMGRQLARRRMLRAVPDADVVVTNPTHIAVALRYDPSEADAPTVLAMGERKVAERIKEIAHEHNVPIVENKPLARALFATARVGMPIPVELFIAVAEVLAWVYRRAGYRPGGRAARAWKGAEA